MLVPIEDKPTNIEGHLDRLLTIKVVEDRIKEVKNEARAELQAAIERVEESTGTAFSARSKAGTATITAPEPKAKVTDPAALADDIVLHAPTDAPVLTSVRASVRADRDKAVALRQHADTVFNAGGDDPMFNGSRDDLRRQIEQIAAQVIEALTIIEDRLVSENALDILVGSGKVRIVGTAAVWVGTGERVRGVEVTTAARTLQVRHPAKAKAERLLDLTTAGSPALDVHDIDAGELQ